MVKLKILFISNCYSDGGGTATVLSNLLSEIDTKKYDITIFEYDKRGMKKEVFATAIKELPAIFYQSQKNKREFTYVQKKSPETIKNLLSLHGYDVIIGWDTYFMLPSFHDEKIISWIHSGVDNLQRKSRDFKYVEKALDCSDFIVTVSQWPQRSLVTQIPKFLHKTKVIYNGVDEEKIRLLSSKKIEFEPKFENQTLPILCFVGRLDATKNPELMMQALAYLNKINYACNLLFVGHGKKKLQLEKMAKKLKVENQVIFAGFQENPYPLMKKANLMCLTSPSETFGMVIAEGMVLGKPFVTTPVAGASEELADNGNCGLVSDYTPENFAKLIKEILDNKEKYETMAKNCKEHVKQFSTAKSIKEFEALTDSLDIHKKNTTDKNIDLSFICVKFAHYCILSSLDTAIMSLNLFFNTKTKYNFAKMGYYHLRMFSIVLLYPISFIRYFLFAKKIQKRYKNISKNFNF